MPEPAEGQVPAGDWEPVPEAATQDPETVPTEEINIVAKEVIAGHWGRGNVRKKKLQDAGYDVAEVSAAITKILNQK